MNSTVFVHKTKEMNETSFQSTIPPLSSCHTKQFLIITFTYQCGGVYYSFFLPKRAPHLSISTIFTLEMMAS